MNIGNPEEMSVLEFADRVIEITESESRIVFGELPVDKTMVRRREISRAKEVLGWESVRAGRAPQEEGRREGGWSSLVSHRKGRKGSYCTGFASFAIFVVQYFINNIF